MSNSKIATRYAKAFLAYAIEKDILKSIYQDVQNILVLSNEVPLLFESLYSPIIKSEKKVSILTKTLSGNVSVEMLHLLTFTIQKGREEHIVSMVMALNSMIREELNITPVKISVAKELTPSQKEKFNSFISKITDSKTEIHSEIDTELIGGFTLQINDIKYDASVSRSLSKLKKELANK